MSWPHQPPLGADLACRCLGTEGPGPGSRSPARAPWAVSATVLLPATRLSSWPLPPPPPSFLALPSHFVQVTTKVTHIPRLRFLSITTACLVIFKLFSLPPLFRMKTHEHST